MAQTIQSRFSRYVDILATLLIIAAAASILVVNGPRLWPKAKPAPALPKAPLELAGAIKLGSKDAKVALIEFSDFQCPYCAKFAIETLPAILSDYVDSGKIAFAFRNYPLEAIHPSAAKAAEIASCAARVDKFRDLHDLMFREQKRLASLVDWSEKMPLSRQEFEKCMADGTAQDVANDLRAAKDAGVKSTPLFFLGRIGPDGRVQVIRMIKGAAPLSQFREAIEAVLRSVP